MVVSIHIIFEWNSLMNINNFEPIFVLLFLFVATNGYVDSLYYVWYIDR